MKRQDKADRVGEMLDDLYPNPPIPLDHTDGYTLLIAVLLSAQTTDERVNMVTPDLFALADNAHDMAKVEVAQIKQAIRSVGLAPTKAKNIRRLSEMLVENNGGEIPETIEELETLPGVGHKTAGVVMTQWFGVPAFPVDTHIHRLAGRWSLSRAKNVKMTEKDLKKVFPRDTWNRRHLQFIYFGREHCPARLHDFDACPICSWAMSNAQRKREVKKYSRK